MSTIGWARMSMSEANTLRRMIGGATARPIGSPPLWFPVWRTEEAERWRGDAAQGIGEWSEGPTEPIQTVALL